MYRGRFGIHDDFEPEPKFSGAQSLKSRLSLALSKASTAPDRKEIEMKKRGLFKRRMKFDDGGLIGNKFDDGGLLVPGYGE